KSKEHVGIKYEIIVTWKEYEKLIEDTGLSYANPRSLVSGKLGDDNAYDFYKYMKLVPLWVDNKDNPFDRDGQLEFIEENFGEDNGILQDYRYIQDITKEDKD